MDTFEVRRYRNWDRMATSGLACFILASVGAVAFRPALLGALASAALFAAAFRQYVIVYPTHVEVRHFVRHQSVELSQVDRILVLYSSLRGWRIRLVGWSEDVDTFSFRALLYVRHLSGEFAAPPRDAPRPVKELYQVLRTRWAAIRS